jgi:hypothetical protein
VPAKPKHDTLAPAPQRAQHGVSCARGEAAENCSV